MDDNKQNYIPQLEEGIDIKKYIFLVLGHWWWFAISIFISLTIAYLVNRYAQDVYSTDCSIIVGEPGSQTGSVESILDELSRVRNKKIKATVENEISILKSYKLARLALEELQFDVTYVAIGRRGIAESYLYNQSPFIVEFDMADTKIKNYPFNIIILNSDTYRLIAEDNFNINEVVEFGEKFKHPDFSFTLNIREEFITTITNYYQRRYYFVLNDINSLSKIYQNALQVDVNDEKGTILTLRINGNVPSQLSDYLNKLSEIYQRSNLEEKNIASENTILFIDEQLGGVVDSLEMTGLRLQNFRTQNKVVDLSKEGSFLYQQMLDLQSEKAMFEIKDNYFNYLYNYVQKRNVNDDIVAPSIIGIQDNLLNQIISELNDLVQRRRQISFSVSNNSPQITLLDQQILDAKKVLQENLRSLAEANQFEMNNHEIRISKIEKELQKLPATEKQMIDIQRKFAINDQIYTFLLQKRAEAGITKASNTSDHKILDVARPENAIIVQPKVSMNYSIGLFSGVGLPLVLLLLIEFFNTKLTDRKYLEANLKTPIIGNIGHNDGSTELPVIEKPGSSLTESFRALRTNIQYLLKEKKQGVIAVTSAVSGEGKTFCSVNLAGILALGGKKTLLISLDLRRPKVHKVFGFDNKVGMSTYLIGKTKIEDLYLSCNVANLWVSTSGPVPPNPAELIDSDKMREFLSESKKHFDYIVIDTPPVAIVTDTLMLQDQLDSLVFVVRHNYSDKQVVELVNGLDEKKLSNAIGVLVNDIQLTGYYGYSYRYGYGYGYGYSYSYRAAYYEDEKIETSWFYKILSRFKI